MDQPVHAGDVVVPSGFADGTGRALPPGEADPRQIVALVMEDRPNARRGAVELVNCFYAPQHPGLNRLGSVVTWQPDELGTLKEFFKSSIDTMKEKQVLWLYFIS